MRSVLRAIGALFLLVLGIGLAWWLSNRWDVAPQPVPAALALPTDAPPEGELLQALARTPMPAQSLSAPNCEVGDCVQAWQAALPKLREQMPLWAGFGQACEAATAQPDLHAVEALPERWTPDAPLPHYTPFSRCATWWAVRAMLASEQGDAEAALAALRQADRLARALQQGSRLTAGQMIAQGQLGRNLQLVVVLAQRHPALRAQLLSLAETDGAVLMAGTRRWIPTEAAFGRGAADSMHPKAGPASATASASASESAKESRWSFFETLPQPEYTKQLMTARWLRALDASQGDDPHAALAQQQAVWQVEPGWFGSSFRWFHTVPHLVLDVAWPSYPRLFERPANLLLASQATALWLRGGKPEQAQGPLRERLSLESNGDWRLRLWGENATHGLPTRWPALRPDPA